LLPEWYCVSTRILRKCGGGITATQRRILAIRATTIQDRVCVGFPNNQRVCGLFENRPGNLMEKRR
jgi:hypothetical protein